MGIIPIKTGIIPCLKATPMPKRRFPASATALPKSPTAQDEQSEQRRGDHHQRTRMAAGAFQANGRCLRQWKVANDLFSYTQIQGNLCQYIGQILDTGVAQKV